MRGKGSDGGNAEGPPGHLPQDASGPELHARSGHRPQVAAGECWRSDAPRLYPDTQSRLARFPAHVSPQASCLPAQATPR